TGSRSQSKHMPFPSQRPLCCPRRRTRSSPAAAAGELRNPSQLTPPRSGAAPGSAGPVLPPSRPQDRIPGLLVGPPSHLAERPRPRPLTRRGLIPEAPANERGCLFCPAQKEPLDHRPASLAAVDGFDEEFPPAYLERELLGAAAQSVLPDVAHEGLFEC